MKLRKEMFCHSIQKNKILRKKVACGKLQKIIERNLKRPELMERHPMLIDWKIQHC